MRTGTSGDRAAGTYGSLLGHTYDIPAQFNASMAHEDTHGDQVD